jgi:hypothetical protein
MVGEIYYNDRDGWMYRETLADGGHVEFQMLVDCHSGALSLGGHGSAEPAFGHDLTGPCSKNVRSLDYGRPSIRLPRFGTLKRGLPLFAVGILAREYTACNFEFSMFVVVKAVSVPRLIEGSSFRSAYWTCGHWANSAQFDLAELFTPSFLNSGITL